MPPGADLACALARVDTARLSGADTVTALRAWYRQHNHATAGLLRAIREAGLADSADAVSRAEELDDWSADEARAALAWSRGRAVMRLGVADDLLCRLPEVFEALDAGLIDEPKAKVFSEWTENVPVDLAHHVCDVLLPEAPVVSAYRLVLRIQEILRALDPEWAAPREKAAEGDRRVRSSRNPTGTATIRGEDLPVDRAVSSMARIETLATRARAAGVAAGMDGLRADVYLGLLDGSYAGLDDAAIVEELRALHPEPANGAGPQGPDHDDRDDGSSEPEDAGPDNDPDDGPNDGPDAGPDAGGPAADPADQDPDGPVPAAAPRSGLERPTEPAAPAGGRRSRKQHVELRLRLSTLLGLDAMPAEIAGWGSVDPALARDVADGAPGAEWRIVSDLRRRPSAARRPHPASTPPSAPRRHPMRCAVVELQVPLSWARALDQPTTGDGPAWSRTRAGSPARNGSPVQSAPKTPVDVSDRGAGSLGAGPRPLLRRPDLRTSRTGLRPRPHHRSRLRRFEQGRQSRHRLQARPSDEAPGWVDSHAAERGRLLVALAHRYALRHRASTHHPGAPGAPTLRRARRRMARFVAARDGPLCRRGHRDRSSGGVGQRPIPLAALDGARAAPGEDRQGCPARAGNHPSDCAVLGSVAAPAVLRPRTIDLDDRERCSPVPLRARRPIPCHRPRERRRSAAVPAGGVPRLARGPRRCLPPLRPPPQDPHRAPRRSHHLDSRPSDLIRPRPLPSGGQDNQRVSSPARTGIPAPRPGRGRTPRACGTDVGRGS